VVVGGGAAVVVVVGGGAVVVVVVGGGAAVVVVVGGGAVVVVGWVVVVVTGGCVVVVVVGNGKGSGNSWMGWTVWIVVVVMALVVVVVAKTKAFVETALKLGGEVDDERLLVVFDFGLGEVVEVVVTLLVTGVVVELELAALAVVVGVAAGIGTSAWDFLATAGSVARDGWLEDLKGPFR
jgi:hypothetical protein